VSARQSRVPLGLAIVGVTLVGLLLVLGWALSQRDSGIRAGVLRYGDITPESITIQVQVVRPVGTAVRCDVAAVGDAQIDVGAARIDIPAEGDAQVVVSATIPTASPPKGARLLGCVPAA
jgi:hypothetical protein